ncbi:MAG: S8 family serine peptidase, partial [Nitrospira sp.]|nr:S8 family serine peptidase [Nitrospira sp.]
MKMQNNFIRQNWLRLGIEMLFSSAFLIIINQPSPVSAIVLSQESTEKVVQSTGRSISTGTDYTPSEVLVKFKEGTKQGDKKQLHQGAGVEVISVIPKLGIERVKSKQGESVEVLLNRYKNNPNVEYVEPNGHFYVQIVPTDSRFSELWGLNNTGQTGGTPDADIDVPEAWDIQTGSHGVIVADIDTGVDYNHPDLAANMWTNPGEIPDNGIDDDGNGFVDDHRGWDFVNNDNDPMDDYGHGTHTAGTIAAVGNNGFGIVGVAWQAKIMPVKFLNSFGSGTFEAAAAAIIYATDMGAKISSNSWGCGPSEFCFSQVVEDAIAYANSKGSLFIVAGMNNNNDNDVAISYPCASKLPNVICVAATDHNDQRAGFSNYGATTVDLGAPGVDVLSTVPTEACPLCDPSGYRFLSGTSMATPHVAGTAALLSAQFPSLTIAQIKNMVMGSVDPNSSLAGITQTGGRLNTHQALSTQFVITGTPDSSIALIGESTTYTVRVSSLVGFSEPVTLSLISPNPNITGSFGINPVTPAPNGSVESTLTISTTVGLARGTYALGITGVSISGETHSAWVTLQVPGPDFEISVGPSTPEFILPGGAATYTVTVTSFVGYSVPVTFNMTSTDPNISSSFSSNPVTPPPDGSVTSTLVVTTTPSISPGTHTLTISASNGLNTKIKSATLLIVDADLVVSEVNGSTHGVIGGPVTISFTVCNQGTQSIGSFWIGLYLSEDASISSTQDILVSRVPIFSLGSRECRNMSQTMRVPFVAIKTYFLGAKADDNPFFNDVPESDETNNARAGNTIDIASGVLPYTYPNFTPIDFPGFPSIFAQDINDSGQIVGFYFDSSRAHGFLLDRGSFTTIDFPGDVYNKSFGMNDSGQIVGLYTDSLARDYGYLFTGGNFSTIDFPGAVHTSAFGINEEGRIVGYFFDPQTSRGYGYLLSEGNFSIINFPGSAATDAHSINDNGQIVGTYTDGNGFHGYLFRDGNFSTVNFPGTT